MYCFFYIGFDVTQGAALPNLRPQRLTLIIAQVVTISSSESDVKKSIVYGNDSRRIYIADNAKEQTNAVRTQARGIPSGGIVYYLPACLYAFHHIHCGCSQP